MMQDSTTMPRDPVLDALLNIAFNSLEQALVDEPRTDPTEATERETRRQRRRKRKRHQGEEPFAGNWWKKTVPNSKRFIPYILKFIEQGNLKIDFHGLPIWEGGLTNIVPEEDGLAFRFSQKFLNDGTVLAAERKLSYPNEKAKSICQGKQTFFGRAYIKLNKDGLLFDTKMLEDGTGFISWKEMTVGYDGIAFFDTEAIVVGIEISPTHGEVILAGWKNVLTPLLEWI